MNEHKEEGKKAEEKILDKINRKNIQNMAKQYTVETQKVEKEKKTINKVFITGMVILIVLFPFSDKQALVLGMLNYSASILGKLLFLVIGIILVWYGIATHNAYKSELREDKECWHKRGSNAVKLLTYIYIAAIVYSIVIVLIKNHDKNILTLLTLVEVNMGLYVLSFIVPLLILIIMSTRTNHRISGLYRYFELEYNLVIIEEMINKKEEQYSPYSGYEDYISSLSSKLKCKSQLKNILVYFPKDLKVSYEKQKNKIPSKSKIANNKEAWRNLKYLSMISMDDFNKLKNDPLFKKKNLYSDMWKLDVEQKDKGYKKVLGITAIEAVNKNGRDNSN